MPLANNRHGTSSQADQPIKVSSATIRPNAAIPIKHSEYADGTSPPLAWSPVNGAKSYSIIAEDPDAKPITFFVHWVAWNIPPDVTKLPKGVQEHPACMFQGRTSRGVVGYFVRGRPSTTRSIIITSRSWRWTRRSTFRQARIAIKCWRPRKATSSPRGS